MVLSLKKITSLKISAEDGEIGNVKDFYFDDAAWNIRYLVVNTGNFLFGKEVLISHYSIKQPKEDMDILPLNLTVDKIKNSPDVTNKLPVSIQKEQELAVYYQWPFYWENIGAIAGEEENLLKNMWPENVIKERNKKLSVIELHLRSFSEVKGYTIKAVDGDIGKVHDFLVDDTTWKIRYLEIDTRKWLPGGKNVLISPAWIEKVVWSESAVYINHSIAAIEGSPVYDENKPISPEYEVKLFKHYGKTTKQ